MLDDPHPNDEAHTTANRLEPLLRGNHPLSDEHLFDWAQRLKRGFGENTPLRDL
jgi:hypothetical protein